MSDGHDERLPASAADERQERSLLHAAPPVLPLDSDLGPPTCVYDPNGKYARRGLWMLALSVVISAAVVVARPDASTRGGAMLYGLALAPPLILYGLFGARRAYEAVGAGWVYVRRTVRGPGTFIRFDKLVRVDMAEARYNPPSLVLSDAGGTQIKFLAKRLRLNGATFGSDLARGVLASNATISPGAREFLSQAQDHQHVEALSIFPNDDLSRARDARAWKKSRPFVIAQYSFLAVGLVFILLSWGKFDSRPPTLVVGVWLIVAGAVSRLLGSVADFIGRRPPRTGD